jgi:dipeptidase E
MNHVNGNHLMKLLLTSAGISNDAIRSALVELLGKPIEASHALFIPTAIYGIRGGPQIVRKVINGTLGDPFCELGWKSLGLLELTALPTIERELWEPMLEQTDALLVGGGDCLYLCHWMRESGLASMLPGLLDKLVYVGLSAGSMVLGRYGTTHGNLRLPADGDKALGLLDFAIHPHLDHPQFADNAMAELQSLAATLPYPSYAIDDETALRVVDGKLDVVSEGNWKYWP